MKRQVYMCVFSGEAGSSEQMVPCELGGETQRQLGWEVLYVESSEED